MKKKRQTITQIWDFPIVCILLSFRIIFEVSYQKNTLLLCLVDNFLLIMYTEVKVKIVQLHLTLCDPLDSSWNSPGQNTGVGSLYILQGIFPTWGLNPDLPYCRLILYQLSHKGRPCTLTSFLQLFIFKQTNKKTKLEVSCLYFRNEKCGTFGKGLRDTDLFRWVHNNFKLSLKLCLVLLLLSLFFTSLNMPANLENSTVATGLEKVSFHSNPKERQCQRMLKLPHNCTHLTR